MLKKMAIKQHRGKFFSTALTLLFCLVALACSSSPTPPTNGGGTGGGGGGTTPGPNPRPQPPLPKLPETDEALGKVAGSAQDRQLCAAKMAQIVDAEWLNIQMVPTKTPGSKVTCTDVELEWQSDELRLTCDADALPDGAYKELLKGEANSGVAPFKLAGVLGSKKECLFKAEATSNEVFVLFALDLTNIKTTESQTQAVAGRYAHVTETADKKNVILGTLTLRPNTDSSQQGKKIYRDELIGGGFGGREDDQKKCEAFVAGVADPVHDGDEADQEWEKLVLKRKQTFVDGAAYTETEAQKTGMDGSCEPVMFEFDSDENTLSVVDCTPENFPSKLISQAVPVVLGNATFALKTHIKSAAGEECVMEAKLPKALPFSEAKVYVGLGYNDKVVNEIATKSEEVKGRYDSIKGRYQVSYQKKVDGDTTQEILLIGDIELTYYPE